jgi:hypothetical protein
MSWNHQESRERRSTAAAEKSKERKSTSAVQESEEQKPTSAVEERPTPPTDVTKANLWKCKRCSFRYVVHQIKSLGLVVDYRCVDKNKKKLSSWEASFVPKNRSWLHLPEYFGSSPLKNEPLSQNLHLKISRLGCRLKLSNSKSCCKVAVLHLLLK